MVCVVSHSIQSYLKNRKQFVSFNNCHSDVPHGSILEPKLFIMYINDIYKVSKVFKYILFADDTNLLCCDRNYKIFGNRRITADIFRCSN